MARPTSLPLPSSRAIALCAFALAAFAGPAFAQHDDDDILVPDDTPAPAPKAKPKIGFAPLVPVGDATRPLAEQVTESLTKELAEVFEVVPFALASTSATKAPPSTAGAEAARDKAAKYTDAGTKALERLQFGRAQRAFQLAVDTYKNAAAALDDVIPVIEAYIGLAEVHARQGDEAPAKAALAEVVRLDPEYELDASKYPPLFISTHQAVRSVVMKEDKSAIVIDRTGAGAVVVIDGRRVGEAPIRVSGLPAGTHFVRVTKEGAGVFAEVVTVGAGEEATVSPGFTSLEADGPLETLALNRFSDAAALKVAEAAKGQGFTTAVVGAVGKTTTSVPTVLIAVDVETGKASRIGPINFDSDLLNVSIEALKAREALTRLTSRGGFTGLADDALVPDVRAASSLEVAEFTMRYDVKAPAVAQQQRSRVLGAEPSDDDEVGLGTGEGGRSILSAGERGSRLSMRDQQSDRLGSSRQARRSEFVPEDTPLTEQAWFWPTAIAGGVVGGLLIVGGGVGALVGIGVIPDPRDRAGMRVNVELPE